MRRRTLEAQVLAGLVVAVLVAVAVPVVYVGISEGSDALRAGLATRALQMGGAALVAVVVAVVALASYAHWLAATDPPYERHEQRVPSLVEVVLVGIIVVAVLMAAGPVASQTYAQAKAALAGADYFWTVGYGALGVAYLWFALWSLGRYVPWARLRQR